MKSVFITLLQIGELNVIPNEKPSLLEAFAKISFTYANEDLSSKFR